MFAFSFGPLEGLLVLVATGLFFIVPVGVAVHASRTPGLTRSDVVRRTALFSAFISGVMGILPGVWLGVGTAVMGFISAALQGALVGAVVALVVLLVRSRSGWFAERP